MRVSSTLPATVSVENIFSRGIAQVSGASLQTSQMDLTSKVELSAVSKSVNPGRLQVIDAKVQSLLSKAPEPKIIETNDINRPEVLFTKLATNIGMDILVYGGIGVLKQGYGMVTGKQDWAGAAANITADLAGGAVAGFGGTVTSSLTAHGMRALGVGGTWGLAAILAGGLIGARTGFELFELTGFRDYLIAESGSEFAPKPENENTAVA